jgi:hypothetical protein
MIRCERRFANTVINEIMARDKKWFQAVLCGCRQWPQGNLSQDVGLLETNSLRGHTTKTLDRQKKKDSCIVLLIEILKIFKCFN